MKTKKNNYYSADDHVFVICAYKQNQYLKECIQSLKEQSCKCNIIIVTSTPNDHIQKQCSVFDIPLFINNNNNGIASDWNFAYQQMKEKRLVTIVHQDDIYESDYLCQILEKANKTENPLIFYSDYYEIREKSDGFFKQYHNRLLDIKRIMNFPLRFSVLQRLKWIRRLILSFGNPICCPSVTYNKTNLPEMLFDTNFGNSCDYKAWAMISKFKGAFVYCPKRLVGHRIYKDSTTSVTIANNIRKKEDLEMFNEFWPKPLARFIYFFYQKAEKSNKNV